MTVALYVPRATVVHRTPAGVKLSTLTGLGVLLFALPKWRVEAGAVVGVLLIGLAAARLPVRLLARHARAVAWWLAAILVLHAVLADPVRGAVAAMRLLALVLAAAVVTATTRVTAMVVVVEQLCAPLRFVGVRPARIGLVVAMTLRSIPLVAERADRIREAQSARGGSVRGLHGLTTMVVPLLVQMLRMAHTVSEALDARGADDVPARGTT